MPTPYPLTVFYDGTCPLCAEEIQLMHICNQQQRLLFVNCAASDFDDRPFHTMGVTRSMMLREIHVLTVERQWLKGIDALETVYRALELMSIARLLGGRFSKPVALRVYPYFVRLRFIARWLGIGLLFRQLSRYHARRAQRRIQSCHQGQCQLK